MVLVVAVVCAAAITLLRLREVPGIGQELGSECGTNKEQVLAVENGDGYKCAVATANCKNSTVPFSREREIFLSQNADYATEWYGCEVMVEQAEANVNQAKRILEWLDKSVDFNLNLGQFTLPDSHPDVIDEEVRLKERVEKRDRMMAEASLKESASFGNKGRGRRGAAGRRARGRGRIGRKRSRDDIESGSDAGAKDSDKSDASGGSGSRAKAKGEKPWRETHKALYEYHLPGVDWVEPPMESEPPAYEGNFNYKALQPRERCIVRFFDMSSPLLMPDAVGYNQTEMAINLCAAELHMPCGLAHSGVGSVLRLCCTVTCYRGGARLDETRAITVAHM